MYTRAFVWIHCIVLVYSRPQEPPTTDTTIPDADTVDPNHVSSEFVFSPERDYVNKEAIAKLREFDTRGPEIPPFYSEERLWGTPPSANKVRWNKFKGFVKNMLGLNKTTTPLPENWTTSEPWLQKNFKKLHHYIKYTILKHTTPNVTVNMEETTEDPRALFSKHYTDWKYWNNLHFEIMNASRKEEHWFYRKLMLEAHGVNLDELSTTTEMEFDAHRLDGYSTNVTLRTTTGCTISDEVISGSFAEELRDMITLRPQFHTAIDEFVRKFTIQTLPRIEEPPDVTYFPDSPLFKKLRDKLISFYWITTNDPEYWMDTHEEKRNKKLGRWLVKEEKRLLASVEKHLQSYKPDFGPKFNAFSRFLANISTPTSKLRWNEEDTTEPSGAGVTLSTNHYPAHVRAAMADPTRMANMSVMDRYIYEHCMNNSIDWTSTTAQPFTQSTIDAVELLKTRAPSTRVASSTRERKGFVIPPEQLEFMKSENFTIDKAKIDRMAELAHLHIRNLSIMHIEGNWEKVSKAWYNDQFTTTFKYDSLDVDEMFKDKIGNYK